MPNFVPDDGSKAARIALIGESPGAHENRKLKPFVGPSYTQYLAPWWAEVGLARKDFYITNVYPYQPPHNKISAIPKLELAGWVEKLHERLAELEDPWLIVPTGDTAITALLGFHKSRESESLIGKHRGSIYEYIDRRGRAIKTIATVHPAALFRQPKWEKRCRLDWARIASDLQFRERRLPERTHIIRPVLGQIVEFTREAEAAGRPLVIDIETPKQKESVVTHSPKTGKAYKNPKVEWGDPEVGCIGFSFDPSFSLTIPLNTKSFTYWQSPEEAKLAVEACRALIENPHFDKSTQNGLFDMWWLAKTRGIHPVRWRYDTLSQHHALDAADDHGLAYLASIDTRQPYWKDDATDPDELQKYASNVEALWTYNGIDSCVQCELTHLYIQRLAEAGLSEFYELHYRAMFAPLLGMMLHGVRVDLERRKKWHAALRGECDSIKAQIEEISGMSLVGKKDLSGTKIKKYMYEHLKLPEQKKRATGKATSDEVAIRKMIIRFPEKFGVVGNHILDYQRKAKLSQFLTEDIIDEDGRIYCSYKFNTAAGRLASATNPRGKQAKKGKGGNLQNQDREIRDTFVPDEGCVFLEVDGAQVESRVVYVMTGDPRLIEIARTRPDEYDMHTENAKDIFKIPAAAVTKEQRYFGKKAVHAAQRGMMGNKMYEELLKDDVIRTPDECQLMIDAYLQKNAPVVDWFQRVRMMILEQKVLRNSWGRQYSFKYFRMGDEAYRQGYSFLPQSECADWLNQWGLVTLWYWLRSQRMRTRINLQVHDALVMSCPPSEVYKVASFLRQSLERSRTIWGVDLVVPLEYKLGMTWAGGKEWEVLPSEEEMTTAAYEVMYAGAVA